MRSEWIIDVLADLKAFAEHNGMSATALALGDASLVAIAEMSSFDTLAGPAQSTVTETLPSGGNVTPLFAHRSLA